MSPESKTEIVASLEESKRLFNATLAGVSDADAARAPADGGWSVLDIIEHLAITEGVGPMLIAKGRKQEDAVRSVARESEIMTLVLNREAKITAPEQIHPKGKFTTVADGLAAFNTARDRTIQYAAAHESELDGTIVTHPLVGEMSVRQLLVLVAGHSTRHIPQMDAALGRA